MKRARFEGSAPWLWVLAALLGTLFFFVDPTRPRLREGCNEPRRRDEGPGFFELPPLPPPSGDAGIRGSDQQ